MIKHKAEEMRATPPLECHQSLDKAEGSPALDKSVWPYFNIWPAEAVKTSFSQVFACLLSLHLVQKSHLLFNSFPK